MCPNLWVGLYVPFVLVQFSQQSDWSSYRLFICACGTGMATVYVRYKQVEALIADEGVRLSRLNCVGLLLGLVSSFGMCVVANFQVRAAAGTSTSVARIGMCLQPHVCVLCESRRPRCSPCTCWERCLRWGSGRSTSWSRRWSRSTCSHSSIARPTTQSGFASGFGPCAASSAVSFQQADEWELRVIVFSSIQKLKKDVFWWTSFQANPHDALQLICTDRNKWTMILFQILWKLNHNSASPKASCVAFFHILSLMILNSAFCQCLYHRSSCTPASEMWTYLANCTGPQEMKSVEIFCFHTSFSDSFYNKCTEQKKWSLHLLGTAPHWVFSAICSFSRATRLTSSARCLNGTWPSPLSASSSPTSGIFRYLGNKKQKSSFLLFWWLYVLPCSSDVASFCFLKKIKLRAEVDLQSSHLYEQPHGGVPAPQHVREVSESSPLLAGGTWSPATRGPAAAASTPAFQVFAHV